MYNEETPKWINFIRAFGEISIVKTPAKLQAILISRGIPDIYLRPAEDHKGDTYTFWNTITKHVFESRSAIFLEQTYADFYKLDKSQIAKQEATITDELNEMFDEDEDVTKEVIEDDYLLNQIEKEEDEDFINITDDMLDPNNPELTYKEREDDAEDKVIPSSV
jgi:hypothetical protein